MIGGITFSCKKEEAPIDYRDKYIGTYIGVATKIHSYYNGTITSKDTTIKNDSVLTITKVGDYPSNEVSLNGRSSFTLVNSNNDVGGLLGCCTFIKFDYPKIQIHLSYANVSNEQYDYNYKGTKQ